MIPDSECNSQIIKSTISSAIGALSEGILTYGLGFMLLYGTHSPLSFGLELVVGPIIDFLFFVPIGNYVDKYNHKQILEINYILRISLLLGFLFILPQSPNDQRLIPVAIFIALNTILGDVSDNTYSASIHELVNQNKISSLNSYEQTSKEAAKLLSPILGVSLYHFINIRLFIVIEIISTLIAFLLMLTMHFYISKSSHNLASTKPKTPHVINDWKVIKRYIHEHKLIRDIMIVAIIANFLATILTIGPSYIIVDRLHLSANIISFINTGLILGAILGSLCFGLFSKKGSVAFNLVSSIFVIGVGTIGLGCFFAFIKSEVVMIVTCSTITFLIGIFLSILNISVKNNLQYTVPSDILGRIISTITAFTTIAMPLGTLIFSSLLKVLENDSWLFVFSGILLIVYILGSLRFIFKDAR